MTLSTILLSTGIAAACTLSTQAALVTGWSVSSGTAPLSDAGTASPILGDGTSDSADASSLYANFSTLSLANVGDKITLSGSVTMTGITTTASGQFRFSLFEGDQSNVDGGYLLRNGVDATSALLNSRNSGNFYSTSGIGAAGTGTAPGVGLTNNGTYSFSMTLELLAGNQISVITSLSDGTNDFGNASLTDAAPNVLSFSGVGFLSGGSLNADQLSFDNIDVSLTSIPEPSSTAFIGLAALGLILRRRR